jgi:hypothetical protein
MRILEGTPAEILEYQNRPSETVVAKQPYVTNERRGSIANAIKRSFLLHESHWSNTKNTWVKISDMNPTYIANVLRKRLNDSKSIDLLEEDDEFKSLVLNLANKIIDGE